MVYPSLVLDLLRWCRYSNGCTEWTMGWNRHGPMGRRSRSWSPISACSTVHVRDFSRSSSRSCRLVSFFDTTPILRSNIVLAGVTNFSLHLVSLWPIASTLGQKNEPIPEAIESQWVWALYGLSFSALVLCSSPNPHVTTGTMTAQIALG